MVCFGSKAIRPKGDRQSDLLDGGLDDGSQKKRGRNDKEEKRRKGGSGSSRKPSAEKPKHSQRKQKGDDQRKGKGRGEERHLESSRSVNNRNVLPSSDASKSVQNVLRKRVDPETAKYFTEISNLFDNKEIDLDERSTICANALEETKGKELELATDAVISHIMQTLIGDLKSLSTHLEDESSRPMIENILNRICKVIAADATIVMSSCYGSHVLWQTALRLSSGDDSELHHIISILLGYDEDDSIHKNSFIEKKSEIVSLLEETAYSHLLEVIVEVVPDKLRNGMLVGTLRGELFTISSHHCGNYVVQALISSAKTSDQMKQIWEELGPKFKELLELGKTGVVASILAACQRLETNRIEASQALASALSSDSESSDSIVTHLLFLEDFLRERSHWKWPIGAKMSVLGCLMLQSIFQYPHQYIRQYVASLLSMEGDQILQISKDSGGSRVLEAFLCSSATAKRKFKVFAKLQGHYGEIAMNPSGSFLVEKCFTASNFSHKEAIVVELLTVQSELSKTKHGYHLLRKLDVERYARRPDQWRSNQTSKETTHRKFQVEFGSNSKPDGQNIEDLFSSQTPTKKRKQKEKTDKITEDYNASKQDLSQKDKNKRLKAAEAISVDNSSCKKHTSEGVSTHASVPFLKGSGKRKSPDFLSDKPSLKKQKYQRPVPGRKLVQDSTSMPFVKNDGKQKGSITELADLAGKEKLTAAEVRKLLKPKMSGTT